MLVAASLKENYQLWYGVNSLECKHPVAQRFGVSAGANKTWV